MNMGYLGKNAKVAKVASNVIGKFCIENQIDRADFAYDLGIMKGTLDNKLKASVMNSSLDIEEVLKICELTGDNSILKAMCKEVGMVAFDPIDAKTKNGDVISILINKVLDLTNKNGKLAQIVSKATKDFKIDEQEEREILDATSDCREVLRMIEVVVKNDTKDKTGY